MDHYAIVIVVFLIMFLSTLVEKLTLIHMSLEKSENIKDFLEILNHFFPLFFSKLCVGKAAVRYKPDFGTKNILLCFSMIIIQLLYMICTDFCFAKNRYKKFI